MAKVKMIRVKLIPCYSVGGALGDAIEVDETAVERLRTRGFDLPSKKASIDRPIGNLTVLMAGYMFGHGHF